jgi:hypothetical protein
MMNKWWGAKTDQLPPTIFILHLDSLASFLTNLLPTIDKPDTIRPQSAPLAPAGH